MVSAGFMLRGSSTLTLSTMVVVIAATGEQASTHQRSRHSPEDGSVPALASVWMPSAKVLVGHSTALSRRRDARWLEIARFASGNRRGSRGMLEVTGHAAGRDAGSAARAAGWLECRWLMSSALPPGAGDLGHCPRTAAPSPPVVAADRARPFGGENHQRLAEVGRVPDESGRSAVQRRRRAVMPRQIAEVLAAPCRTCGRSPISTPTAGGAWPAAGRRAGGTGVPRWN